MGTKPAVGQLGEGRPGPSGDAHHAVMLSEPGRRLYVRCGIEKRTQRPHPMRRRPHLGRERARRR